MYQYSDCRKITAVVIDDEVTVRNGMLRHIKWKQLGVDEVKTVENAEEAVVCLEEEAPEIIISDIKLPGMDGIQLGEYVRNKGLNCKIIFMSAYSDLEYYRGALRTSAEDYIEKPIDLSKMEKVLKNAVLKVRMEQAKEREEIRAKNIIESHTEYAESYVLNCLLHGQWDEDGTAGLLQKNRILMQGDYLCMIIKVKGETEEKRENPEKKLEEYFRDIRHVHAKKGRDTYVYLFSFSKNEYLTEVCQKMNDFYQECNSGRFFSLPYFVAVSSICRGHENIPAIYSQAVCLLQQLFFKGFNCVMMPQKENGSPLDIGRLQIKEFDEALLEKKGEKAIYLAKQIYGSMKEKTNTPPNIVKNVFITMNLALIHMSAHSYIQTEDGGEEQNFFWVKFNEFETIDECFSYLMDRIHAFFQDRESYYYGSRMVNGVVGYIRANFRRPELSVKDIADAVNLSPQHMTSVFKENTGMTVGQYIKKMRLDFSYSLLKKTDMSLSEIADSSGYTDENYWAKVFKKEYGSTPSEYRKQDI